MIGWFYQLIICSNFSEASILWIAELSFFESLATFLTGLGWIIGAVYYILMSVSLLYGFIYFIVLIFYIIMLPFKKTLITNLVRVTLFTLTLLYKSFKMVNSYMTPSV